ncbi:DUF1796 family putative cysteine peptidase [Bacillus thuringiensis]|uniref:DUF1796 family putative cysteine peptidase n=1 Tax=Bacillus thuringiensis TaxID=1428 RepID=UPI003CFF876D
MKLIDIQQNYIEIFSLSNQYFTSRKLYIYQLEPYADVIDWIISFSLTDVVRLLQNLFMNFMEKEAMICEGYNPEVKGLLLVKGSIYNIISVHDFLSVENTSENLITYLEFKTKIDRRVKRFLNKLKTYNNILFIQIGATIKEVELVEKVLSELIEGQFKVLLLNLISEYKIVEYGWKLDYICSVGISINRNKNHDIWNQLLKGLTQSDIQ